MTSTWCCGSSSRGSTPPRARPVDTQRGRGRIIAGAGRFAGGTIRSSKARLIRRGASGQLAARVGELEQVLEHTGEAIIVKDLDAVVTYWNREATALYGFSAAEAIGRTLRQLHAADLPEADYARILARIRAGKPTSSTTDRRKRSGESVRVALRTTPLRDVRGRLIGEITVARDVTALHRSEEALRGAQATLEARMAAIRESNRNLTREIAARRKTESAMRKGNQAMSSTVRQLEGFHRDGEVLSRMTELLQSSTQRTEAYGVVRETATQLFPGVPGALYIYRESRDVLEHAADWSFAQAQEPTVAPEDCWALRLGRPHYVVRRGAVRCRHAPEESASYVCMPVQGQGQVLGLLHLALEVGGRSTRPADEADRRLRSFTDSIGPALANLKLRDALRELALHDTLTGLYNRRYMEEAVKRELHRAQRNGKSVAVIMIDIDHFKLFNDKYGHDAGDFVLSAVARTITKNIRPSDIACRYGGEELTVVLPEASLECARDRAETLRIAIRSTNLTHLGQTLPGPSASLGVSAYPVHGENLAEILKAADLALYRAKQAGRDQVCVAEEPAETDPIAAKIDPIATKAA